MAERDSGGIGSGGVTGRLPERLLGCIFSLAGARTRVRTIKKSQICGVFACIRRVFLRIRRKPLAQVSFLAAEGTSTDGMKRQNHD
ncbi:hypothetical protein [Erythrobacter sanguineus]|uniref:hypothetical protein n=1 Tax=Erythrobacter sanguineus TaxID=198312 RepID=UPI0011609D19|nr:hypothetical protein [Erythrobacter sanguineus]